MASPTSTPAGSDETLVLEARSNSVSTRAGAFRRLYHRHARYIAGVAFRILGSDAEVEDVVQDTFTVAARSLGQLRDPAGFRRWVRTVCVRQCIRRIEARDRRRQLDEELGKAMRDDNELPQVRENAARALHGALSRIDAAYRVPWALHHIEGLSLPETAEACNVSLATVKRRIKTAHERLERRLSDER